MVKASRKRALEAEFELDRAWRCAKCGHRAEGWAAHCANCEAFDTLHWGAPRAAAPRGRTAAFGCGDGSLQLRSAVQQRGVMKELRRSLRAWEFDLEFAVRGSTRNRSLA